MNKYSKKKNIWNTTYDLQSGPISVVLGAVVLAVFYAIGAVVYHISKKAGFPRGQIVLQGGF